MMSRVGQQTWADSSVVAAPPTRTLSAEEGASATGQSATLPHGWPRTDAGSEASGVRTLRMHSVLPEFFPRESQRPSTC